MGDESLRCPLVTAAIVIAIGCFLIVLLIPMSFSYLEYYQYGFKRRKSTGNVDLDHVYSSGRSFIGPDFEFKVFQADAHLINLDDVDVFTSDKLQVGITVTLQYFLRKSDLPLLHKQYDLYYEDVMKASALDAVKGATTTFDTRQMISDRERLESTLNLAVRQRLGGTCCAKDCTSFKFACYPGCTNQKDCTNDKKGLFADVKYFQLGAVTIPSDVKDRFMKALTLKEEALAEQLLQEAQVIRKNTTAMVKRIKNEAQEISQNGTAQAALIQTVAQANYTAKIETARAQGLKDLFTKLGVSDQRYKNSFDYLRMLRGGDNLHFTVDFQQLIAGKFGSS